MNNGMNNMMNTPRSYYNYGNYNPTSEMPTNNILWVQGREGAKAYQLNPNSRAILLDSETEGKMYIKVCDNIGISSLRIFNYEEELPADNINNDVDLSQYVKKDELKELIKEALDEQSVSTVGTNATITNAAASITEQSKSVF